MILLKYFALELWVSILRVKGYIFQNNCISFFADLFVLVNSVDPDGIPHYVAFHLGLHCLNTVNPEIFARIFILQIALKDILSTGKFRNLGMIHIY